MDKPCQSAHGHYREGCPICWLARNDGRYRALWNIDFFGPVEKRHLLYHVYPRRSSSWRTRVLALRERIELFNGRRIIAIAHDGTTEHPDLVRDALAGTDCEIVAAPNNPELRELATFELLFSRLSEITGPEHATLYAHAKGTTRPKESTAQQWARALEETCLDYWPFVADLLKAVAVCGPFKRLGRCWRDDESQSTWHYSGSWFWFRNDQLFTKPDWRRFDSFWGGIEAYPSLHWSSNEAGCIVHERELPALDLYNRDYWNHEVEPDLQRFRSTARRTLPPGVVDPPHRQLNVGCGIYYAPGWTNTGLLHDDVTKPDIVVTANRPLPFRDGVFDRAYCGHLLEHLPWDHVTTFLADLRRVVRIGGEVCILGPDIKRALAKLRNNSDDDEAMSNVWAIAEDRMHYQQHAIGIDRPGLRHQWNCYEERVLWVMGKAGFVELRAVPIEESSLKGWPVVDLTNSSQCAVIGKVL